MRLLWSAEAAPALQGLALAREGGRLLAWDARHGLFLFDSRGHRLVHRAPQADTVNACCSGDGASFATLSRSGLVRLLDQELMPRWEQRFPQEGSALALDSFADRIAVADAAGGLHLLDGQGKSVWQVTSPRPLRFVTFIPEVAALFGSADFGLVLCCDALGRCVWRDTPVTHTGSIAASGDGSILAVARYSDGVCCYGLQQNRPHVVRGTAPSRLADVSYDGRFFLTAGLDDRLCLRDATGGELAVQTLPARLAALALAPAGDRAALALANGTILVYATRVS
jgi:hypothetical protein